MDELRHKARIKLEHKVEYPNPIQVAAGERVSVGREDDEFPGWMWCQASDGRQGWIPVELLFQQGATAAVLQDYSAQELAVRPGDEVEVVDSRREWILVRNESGKQGWIPASCADLKER
jgi:uncharacterized protein YgiM (DUF1202 family)